MPNTSLEELDRYDLANAMELLCLLSDPIHDIPPPETTNPPPTAWVEVPVWSLLLNIQMVLIKSGGLPSLYEWGCRAYAGLTGVRSGIEDNGLDEEDHWLLITRLHVPDLQRPALCLHYPFPGMQGGRMRVGAAVLEGLIGGVSRAVASLQTKKNPEYTGSRGRQILEAIAPSGWESCQQSDVVTWVHTDSGARCLTFPFLGEIYVHIFSETRPERAVIKLWAPWQCTLQDLALLLPIQGLGNGLYQVGPRSSFTFFTRDIHPPHEGHMFGTLRRGHERIGSLLESKAPMLTAGWAPLTAVDEDNQVSVMAHVFQENRGGSRSQACMARDTQIRLAKGAYCHVKNLSGKTVATTDGDTALVVRVHRFYMSDDSHRLIKHKDNWITDNHFIRYPTTTESHAIRPQEGHLDPLPGRWTQADGRQWWKDGRMVRTDPKFNLLAGEDTRYLEGEAVFNLELDKLAGVFLLNGVEAATLGNGVFLRDSFPTCHASLFVDLSRRLAQLLMQDQRVIKWGPGACTANEEGTLCLDYSRLLVPVASMAGWLQQTHLSTFQRSFIEGTSHQLHRELVV